MNDMHNNDAHHGPAESMESTEHDVDHVAGDEEEASDSSMMATVATVGVVGVGVVMLEAALLPGMLLGVAAVAAPKYLPRLGSALTPIFRSTVRGVYKATQKTREFVAEAHEQVGDIVAEIESENDQRAEENLVNPVQQKV
jgi:hypothetical protein